MEKKPRRVGPFLDIYEFANRAQNKKKSGPTIFWALGRSTIPEKMKGLPKKTVGVVLI